MTNKKPHLLPPYQRNATLLTKSKAKAKPYIPPPPLPKRSDYLQRFDRKPIVQYTAKAWDSMHHLVTHCPTELGWVGAVEQVNQFHYIIHDLRVMEQVAGAATFEYDDWNKPVTEMIVRKTLCAGRYDANLGHSHVNMSVTPSGTDEEQMVDLAHFDTNGKPTAKFSLQTITNKRGEHYCAIYDWEHEVYYEKCETEVLSSLTQEDIADLNEQIKRVKPYSVKPYQPYSSAAFHRDYDSLIAAQASTYGIDPPTYNDFSNHTANDPEWDNLAWDMWESTNVTEQMVTDDQINRNAEFFKTQPHWDDLAKEDFANGYAKSVVEHRLEQRTTTST